jgi:hypothetical protein
LICQESKQIFHCPLLLGKNSCNVILRGEVRNYELSRKFLFLFFIFYFFSFLLLQIIKERTEKKETIKIIKKGKKRKKKFQLVICRVSREGDGFLFYVFLFLFSLIFFKANNLHSRVCNELRVNDFGH